MEIKDNEFYIKMRCAGNTTSIIGQISYDSEGNRWAAKNECGPLCGYGDNSVAAVIDLLQKFNV